MKNVQLLLLKFIGNRGENLIMYCFSFVLKVEIYGKYSEMEIRRSIFEVIKTTISTNCWQKITSSKSAHFFPKNLIVFSLYN